jgi:signal transduction histidine kinase
MLPEELEADVRNVQRVDAVPSILEVICRVTGMGFAAVARVTEDRWVACAVKDDIAFGLQPGGELKVETTICNEIRQSKQAVVIDHVAEDAAFCRHPTPALYGFQSYISVPILRSNGTFFGTLCAIDPRPITLNTPETVGMFKLFADLITLHLDALDRLTNSEETLANANRVAVLREQFIAVLGHDLRNPLASVKAGVELLEKRVAGKPELEILTMMKSSANRMSGLVHDMLDLARSRSVGGFALNLSEVDLRPVLSQVVEELKATAPGQQIICTFALRQPVWCDPARIAQLLSNLLSNAVSHGASDKAIEVEARTADGGFELVVVNHGETIPADTQERLFQPFFRGSDLSGGLGLGLYIASEVARAHGGTLRVSSSDNRTAFTLRLPCARDDGATPS